MKRFVIGSLLLICVSALVISLGTFAYFSDSASSTGNTFSAGTLDISAGTSTWSAGVNNMKPGDTKTLTLTVNSLGTLPLNYTVSTALGGVLAGGINPCYVSAVRIDGVAATADSLTEASGADASDTVEVDVTMPAGAGNEYQGQSGTLDITINALQQ